MKWTVQIELFGHKFNVPVEAFDEEEAKEAAMVRAKKSIKVVGIQQGWKEKKPPPNNEFDHIMNMLGFKK